MGCHVLRSPFSVLLAVAGMVVSGNFAIAQVPNPGVTPQNAYQQLPGLPTPIGLVNQYKVGAETTVTNIPPNATIRVYTTVFSVNPNPALPATQIGAIALQGSVVGAVPPASLVFTALPSGTTGKGTYYTKVEVIVLSPAINANITKYTVPFPLP
jgi:hypothetical protein